jgi:uncharacterized protein YcfL
MKKLTFILASLTLMFLTSCKEQTDKTTDNTVIIEKNSETEAQPAEKSDGTSLSIDNEGVDFSTKDGSTNTEVSVKK